MTFLLNNAVRNGRIHNANRNNAPVCGGGNSGKQGKWQLDIGPATCKRCQQILGRQLHNSHRDTRRRVPTP